MARELLVVGVKWPPETFIARRLASLAKTGFVVRVATTSSNTLSPIPGVSVLPLRSWRDPLWKVVPHLLGQLARLSISSPTRLKGACIAAGGALPSGRMVYANLRKFLPLAQISPDLVHFEWNSAAIELLPLYRLWDCPIVISCRGWFINVEPHLRDENYRRDLARSFSKADAVHCVSKAILYEAEKYGLDRRKAVVITPAVDQEAFKYFSRPTTSSRLRIVSTGTLMWRKGYEYALMAVAELKQSVDKVFYTIIGDGPDRQRILYTIAELGLRDNVQLLGNIAPEEVLGQLHRADIFLHPSLSEGISNAVLEAMSTGMPVVVTDCGGMREAVEDGIEGFVCPPRDPGSLAKALLHLCDSPALRERMGRAARQRVESDFRLEDQTEQFCRLYNEVLSEWGEKA